MAERFKASTKKINQNLADAIVSLQTGCRAYQVEQPVSNIRVQLSVEEKHWDKDNYMMTNGVNGDRTLQAWTQAL